MMRKIFAGLLLGTLMLSSGCLYTVATKSISEETSPDGKVTRKVTYTLSQQLTELKTSSTEEVLHKLK